MPHVGLETPSGVIELHYNIATPTTPSATHIVPHLPCILFLHSGYIGSEVFEPQFQDPRLRLNFNLIGLDMRGYGETKAVITKQIFTPADSADDVYRFLQALDLPPVHVFGLALGSCVGLELATLHPELVLSLTLCSPLPGHEPEDVTAGRVEVYNFWVQAMNHDEDPATVADQAILHDLMLGCQHLCFNNQRSKLTDALTEVSLQQAILNRAGSPEKLKLSYQISVGMFLNRRPQSVTALSRIRCPIRLIHCDEDIAYPLSEAQELETLFRSAGLTDVVLYEVPAPHYGNVTNPQAINPILVDVVLSVTSATEGTNRAKFYPLGHPTEAYQKMDTPFSKSLASYGYDPQNEEEESDSEPCYL